MKTKGMNVQWIKSVTILIMIVTIYKIMSNLDVYGIACSLLVVALVLSISYARNQARKDIEMMKSSKTRSLQFEYIPRKTRRFNVLKLEELRAIDPFAFERYVAKILQLHGFSDAYATQEGGDGGKDVIFTIDGKLYYSECKRFGANHSVGRPIVQKLVGSALADNAIPYAIFTTGRFTKEAIEEAKKTGVKCIGPVQLLDMIERAEKAEREKQVESTELNTSVSSN